MNRTARKVALSAAAGAVALALTSPAAVADDGDGYEGERDGYSEEYDESESDDSEDSEDSDDYESEDYEEYDESEGDADDDSDDDSDDDWEEDHEDGDEYDDDSDGREYDAYHERHHGDHAEEPRSHSGYRGHGDGGSLQDAEDAEEREARTESFIEQQTAILTHLSRADAFLADLSERITAADLDPGLKNALLSLIDERRNHLAGLVAQVRTATSWENLKSLRDDAYGEMTEPTT